MIIWRQNDQSFLYSFPLFFHSVFFSFCHTLFPSSFLSSLSQHLFVSTSSVWASQCSWPSCLTLPFHLLFSCCPAEGSSRRAVPSGEPRAWTPNEASQVEFCTLPLLLDSDILPHRLTLRCIKAPPSLHKHAMHT